MSESVEDKDRMMMHEASSQMYDFVMLNCSDHSNSPLETLMSGAFAACQIKPTLYPVKLISFQDSEFEWLHGQKDHTFSPYGIYIFPEVKVGNYRVDFLCMATPELPERQKFYLAIECDGHEFHEKTKMQAARDKARDRFIVGQGIPMMRFTGSEIWRDPMACAEQALDYFKDKVMPLRRTA
jgi:very-short-patch-repair endonuclease